MRCALHVASHVRQKLNILGVQRNLGSLKNRRMPNKAIHKFPGNVMLFLDWRRRRARMKLGQTHHHHHIPLPLFPSPATNSCIYLFFIHAAAWGFAWMNIVELNAFNGRGLLFLLLLQRRKVYTVPFRSLFLEKVGQICISRIELFFSEFFPCIFVMLLCPWMNEWTNDFVAQLESVHSVLVGIWKIELDFMLTVLLLLLLLLWCFRWMGAICFCSKLNWIIHEMRGRVKTCLALSQGWRFLWMHCNVWVHFFCQWMFQRNC
jgi:hypothetical protein